MKLFLSPDEPASPEAAGQKARMLNQMRRLGYRVPRFFVTPPSLSEPLLSSRPLREALAKEACARHPGSRWAVRSNHLDEDGPQRSRAGKFESVLDLSPGEIADAVKRVLAHARTATGGDLSRFSLIIQEFLPAEYEGVIFTRNPLGTGELVAEYSSGGGGRVTSGIAPRSRLISDHRDLSAAGRSLPPPLAALLPRMALLESQLGFPQDLEWCIHRGRLFVLQCRPVTTLSRDQYEAMLELDRDPALSVPHLFEKAELSEIAPRPKPFLFALLARLFERDGPCDRVYRKYGIRYGARPFLARFGNELYTDRETEFRNFFPAKTLLAGTPGASRWSGIRGLWTTLNNTSAIRALAAGRPHETLTQLETVLRAHLAAEPPAGADWQGLVEGFLREYDPFFEINLLAGALTRKVEPLLIRAGIPVAEALARGIEAVPAASRAGLEAPLDLAVRAGKLRDRSRLFFERRMRGIEAALLTLGTQNGIEPADLLLFATPEELGAGIPPAPVLLERKRHHLSLMNRTHPATLHRPARPARAACKPGPEPAMVSPGSATGVLVTVKELEAVLEKARASGAASGAHEEYILWSELMEPSLERFFPHIKGLLATQGGLLSHLSILAREAGIPAIVHFTPGPELPAGSRIQISNEGGTPVIRIDSSRIRA